MDPLPLKAGETDRPEPVPPPAGPKPEHVRAALAKILASKTFQTAEGQRNFLRYVVEQKLAGRENQIKEYSVGVEVFGRDESFDPRSSSIVRSEARKLRARIAKYYDTEGASDSIRIDFPKGGYVPGFSAISAAAPAAPPPPVESSEPAAVLGYVSVAVEEPPPAEPQPSFAPLQPPASRRILYISAGAIVLIAVAATFLFWRNRTAGTVSIGPPSIAVLPFTNLSDEKDDSFSDGLTDELIDSLSRVPGLRVVARTSVFQYKGKTEDIREIGKALAVRTVLTGSVRKYGDRLRIVAQLNDAVNGYNLWSESYDRQLKDALAIQREISKAITNSFARLASTTGGAMPRNPQGQGVNPDAYLEYLKGLYARNQRTPENVKLAVGHFQAAIARDPNFAPAHSGLAEAYTDLPMLTPTPVQEVIPRIRAAAYQALDLDGSLSEPHRALAWALVYDYDWPAAETEFRKAIDLNPGGILAHRDYAHFLQRTGRVEEALREDERAVGLDPISPRAIEGVARCQYYMHHYDEAIQQDQRALVLDPNSGTARQALGLAYFAKKSYAQGIAETETARRLMDADSFTTAQLAYGYGVSGNAKAAREILAHFLAESQRGPFPALAIAHVFIGLGERRQALLWLGKAVDQHDVNLNLKVDPIYEPLRSDPGFRELLQRSKLN